MNIERLRSNINIISATGTQQQLDNAWLAWFRAVAEGIGPERLEEICNAERDGKYVILPDSDWSELIIAIATIVENDFLVYKDGNEYVIKDAYFYDGDEFSFSANCICLQHDSYGVPGSDFVSCNGENENCEYCDTSFDGYKFYNRGKSPEECGCLIDFRYSDIGKTVFTDYESTRAALDADRTYDAYLIDAKQSGALNPYTRDEWRKFKVEQARAALEQEVSE